MSDAIRDALMKAWGNRPWKDQAQNPPSMMPQLSLALSLLHPNARNLTMARDLARNPGSATGQLGNNLPPNSIPQPGRPMDLDIPANANGNYAVKGQKLRAYESYVDAVPPNVDPALMQTFFRHHQGY